MLRSQTLGDLVTRRERKSRAAVARLEMAASKEDREQDQILGRMLATPDPRVRTVEERGKVEK
jgi:hypothetical protein